MGEVENLPLVILFTYHSVMWPLL